MAINPARKSENTKGGIICILFLLFCLNLAAQNVTLEGIVFDDYTKQRVSRVYIYNLSQQLGTYNNLRGEFRCSAKTGDVLIAAAEGYSADTLTVKDHNPLLFFLHRKTIYLREVQILGKRIDPQKTYEDNQRDYKDIYRKGNKDDLLTAGSSGGAGLSIDALWSLLSKEGKHARHLQQILENDYRDMMIDYRFSQAMVKRTTGIEDKDTLFDFMQQYRPSYYFILQASDYALISYVKYSYQQYKKDPAAFRTPPLKLPNP